MIQPGPYGHLLDKTENYMIEIDQEYKRLFKVHYITKYEYDIPFGIESIEPYSFANLRNLVKITIPSSVKIIKTGAFCECTNLTDIIFSKHYNEITIKYKAFWKCYSLTTISLPLGLKRIENEIFLQCDNLVRIEIPASVSDIDSYAFNDLSSLNSIVVDNSNEHFISIGGILMKPGRIIRVPENHNCYPNGKLAFSIEFAIKSASSIADCAFRNTKIQSLFLPYNIRTIEKKAFENCINLTDLEFDETSPLTFIPLAAFKGCVALKNVKLPNEINIIGVEAFYGCTSLSLVSLPQKLWRIKRDAFLLCQNLRGFIFRSDNFNKIRNIDNTEFYLPVENPHFKIYVPQEEKKKFIDIFPQLYSRIESDLLVEDVL